MRFESLLFGLISRESSGFSGRLGNLGLVLSLFRCVEREDGLLRFFLGAFECCGCEFGVFDRLLGGLSRVAEFHFGIGLRDLGRFEILFGLRRRVLGRLHRDLGRLFVLLSLILLYFGGGECFLSRLQVELEACRDSQQTNNRDNQKRCRDL